MTIERLVNAAALAVMSLAFAVTMAPDWTDAKMQRAPKLAVSDDDDDCCEEILKRLELVEIIISAQQSGGSASIYWLDTVNPGGAYWQCITAGYDTSYITQWDVVEGDCP